MPANFQTIPEIFPAATQMIVYHDGVATTYDQGDAGYIAILAALDTMAQGSHEMPAFGVSLDTETRQARNSGLWLELIFDGTQSFHNFHFDSLLFAVQPDHQGFNLMRQLDGRYEGRCLYLALAGDMQELFDTLSVL